MLLPEIVPPDMVNVPFSRTHTPPPRFAVLSAIVPPLMARDEVPFTSTPPAALYSDAVLPEIVPSVIVMVPFARATAPEYWFLNIHPVILPPFMANLPPFFT